MTEMTNAGEKKRVKGARRIWPRLEVGFGSLLVIDVFLELLLETPRVTAFGTFEAFQAGTPRHDCRIGWGGWL